MLISRKKLMIAAVLGLAGFTANAQLSLSSSSPVVSEDFNNMWDSSTMEEHATEGGPQFPLPTNWKVDRNMDAPRKVGTWNDASTTFMYSKSEDLSGTEKNGTYAWGASSDKNDRAIGGLSTGSVGNGTGTRGVNLMTWLKNDDSDKIITNVNLDYAIEKYRFGNNGAGFSVRVFTSKDGEKWTEDEAMIESFVADSETKGTNPVPISTTPKNGDVRVHVEPGESLYIAWNISATTGSTCSGAPGYAIDDITITATFEDSDDDWEEEDEPEINPSGIYIRGGLNGWGADSDWEFSKISETEYKLYNKTISGEFKIGDSSSNWSVYNFGSNGSNITMGEPYTLTGGSNPGNISCGSLSFPCAEIVLTIEDGTATLTLIPNTSTKGLTAVYMVGDFNNWNYMSNAGKLELDKDDNLFKGQVGLTAGEDGFSHWMIYQKLAMAGAWGLESDETSASDNGTLIAGEKGHVASNPGMYDVTFNLETGEYTLTSLPSTATSLKLSPAKTTLVPVLPEKVKVLSLNNSLIHYNDQAKVFNDIAAAMNKDAVWTKHTNLGKTLQYHWDEGDGMTEAGEPGAKMMIRSDAWSHIILQEQTILPRTDFSSFSNSVKQWVNYIREYCPNPNAVIILPLNWALSQDWSNFTDYNKILLENYNKVAQEYGVVICPVGLAYQAKYEKDGEATEKDWFLPEDDRHPTLKATYLAALMEYGIIFNENPSSVAYYPNYTTDYDKVGEMNENIAAEMREYASNALEAYSNVVNHHNSTVNLSANVLDQYDIVMPDETVEWSVIPQTATIDNGVFTATENGEYTVTATSGSLTSTAVILVTNAETEVPQIDFIELSENNLEYLQDFDSMGTAADALIPTGWRADRQLKERTIGSYLAASTNTMYASKGENFGSTATNGVWNFGDSSDLTDRALGGVTTDVDGGAKSINIYAAFKNTGVKTISSLDLSYAIEKYRNGSNSAGFTVQLYTSADGRTWTPANDSFTSKFEPSTATAGEDETPISVKVVTGTLELNMVPGTELFLAWNISATTGSSCSSAPMLSIDNVEITANLKPVPEYDYYIYIENQSGYNKTALYAWGAKEIWGSWPGQNPIDFVEIDGIHYEVFGHNEADGDYNIIYNNNNNGSQHNDYAITGGQDYYLLANGTNLVVHPTSGVETIVDENGKVSIMVIGDTVICEGASEINVISLAGAKVAKFVGAEGTLANLAPGVYVVFATTPQGPVSAKVLKK